MRGTFVASLALLGACAPAVLARRLPAPAPQGQSNADCAPALNLTSPPPSFDEPFKTTASTEELLLPSRRGILSFFLAASFEDYREGYLRLWSGIEIESDRRDDLERHLTRLRAGKASYETVAQTTGVPWWWVAITHGLEAGYDFSKHLHNGDPLSARTVHVPRGRPVGGSAPFAWEASAADALGLDNLTASEPWSDIAYVAYAFERYNGFGYRSKGINSPYLWSFSNHYSKGKYVADGRYDPEATSQQAGAMSILKLATETGVVNLAGTGNPVAAATESSSPDCR